MFYAWEASATTSRHMVFNERGRVSNRGRAATERGEDQHPVSVAGLRRRPRNERGQVKSPKEARMTETCLELR